RPASTPPPTRARSADTTEGARRAGCMGPVSPQPPTALPWPARCHRDPHLATTLLQSDLPGLTLRRRGKVRDVYDLPGEGEPRMLMVATHRLSAFDVVLPDPIPGKVEMLCQISNFWFGRTAH